MIAVKQSERIERFVGILHEWYLRHRRELPWRDLWDLPRDERAYRVWISEVMLQQTQVARVIGSFKKFIQEFPHVESLAKASNRDVLMVWRGMGYNSRALRLRDGAQQIVDGVMVRRAHHDTDHVPARSRRVSLSSARPELAEGKADGVFPESMEDLLAIPGIGAYTAGAIRTFAFDLPTSVIDTNIRRILHRTFIGPEGIDGTWKADDKKLLPLMEKVMAAWVAAGHRGSDLLSALMDYGSLVQTKTNPKWELCVLTHANLMRARPGSVRASRRDAPKKEPGRMVGATFIPNRIFRGRIVDVLRDHPNGLKFDDIAKWISPDHSDKLNMWLDEMIKKLVQDGMIVRSRNTIRLAD